ncbi:helix-turn-helix transcriptional regulator [Candidatus Gottesmanbacteria bacterium]|nr:helix-turn-helix transcriptional regulator [Candidatus Gottesmanbacteria bacterium]
MSIREKNRLEKLRESRLLAREELAVKAGLSMSTINRLEQGKIDKPSLKTKRKLSEALEISLEELEELLSSI